MEIVIIEKEAFEAFMAEVSALAEKVDRLCARGKERRLKKWMDGEDVCRLLRLSPRADGICHPGRFRVSGRVERTVGRGGSIAWMAESCWAGVASAGRLSMICFGLNFCRRGYEAFSCAGRAV